MRIQTLQKLGLSYRAADTNFEEKTKISICKEVFWILEGSMNKRYQPSASRSVFSSID